MSDKIYVATRKGLFTLERARSAKWSITGTAFLGLFRHARRRVVGFGDEPVGLRGHPVADRLDP